MTTLSWPAFSVQPTRFEWWLEALTQEHVSPFSGSAQTQETPGAKWAARVEYHNASPADCNLHYAFIAQMRGRAGRVYLGNLGRPAPQGAGGGTPLVAGGSQTGTALAIDGAALSASPWLKAGDLVGIGGRLHMQVADVATDGTGAATLTLAPPIWTAYADNAPLTLTLPTATFMFRQDRQGWAYEPGSLGRTTFVYDLIEFF